MATEEEIEKERAEVDGQIRQFGGRFEKYLVIVIKEGSPGLFWKSNDRTWALGAVQRYAACSDEMDREEERQRMRGN